jgi:hypothetical protein
MHCYTRNKPNACPFPSDRLSTFRGTRINIALLLGLCSRQLRKSCAGANVVFPRREHVFNLGNCIASKSFAAIRAAFSKMYSENEVRNKTLHQLVAELRDTEGVCDKKYVLRRTVLTYWTLVNVEKHCEHNCFTTSFLCSMHC